MTGKSESQSASNKQPEDPGGLIQKWKSFFDLWLEPFNASLTVLMVTMYVLGSVGLGTAAGVIANTVLAIAAGILGGRIANAVSTVNSEAVLKARGTVAVRGLMLMLRNIQALERRVQSFAEVEHEPVQALAQARRDYSEIVEMCRVLSEEGVSSVENWTDIVPEAQHATLVGQMTNLKIAIQGLQEERDSLVVQLAGVAAGAEEEKAKLRSLIEEGDERLRSLEGAYNDVTARIAKESASSMTDAMRRSRMLWDAARSSSKPSRSLSTAPSPPNTIR